MSEVNKDESWRGKIGGLQREEFEAFLGEGKIARLACLDKIGRAHV
jgi:hypothetical protein